ncbi:MAG: FtsX-like permease family protein [Luteitalea sp.]|nr:FtsX-like permease family protein [Luteitalea sp.]
MRILHEWIHRLWGTLHPRRSDRELEQELHLHLELAAEEARRRGRAPDDALRAARIQAGGVSQAMDALRDQRGLRWLDDLARDVRHGLRTLRRSPVFTAVALLTLALGIGANTAIFSIVHGVILRPLDYPQPEQLMYLTTRYPGSGIAEEFWVAAPEYMEFREINRSFSAVGAYSTGEVNLMASDRPRRVRSALVDAYLLKALDVEAAEGRLFADGETEVRGPQPESGEPDRQPLPIAILSHELWQTAFGGRPIVGETVEVDGRRREVIGILSPGADLMDNRTEIWLPLGLNPANENRGSHFLYLVGRLKDGVTAQSAQTELDALIENWGERVGVEDHVFTPLTEDGGHILQMKPLQEEILGDATRSIWVVQAAVGLVLLIACANLANLLLARAETRHHEFAVRQALGASRGRLLRQFMTEGVLVSLAGGALGLLLARIGLQALLRAHPDSLPRTSEVTLDAFVLLFTLGISTATGVLFGAAPIMRTRVNGLVRALKEGGTRGAIGTAHNYIRRGLVMGEVALAVMLVIGAGLLVRTVYNLTNVDAGFDRSRLVTFSMTLPQATYPSAARVQTYQRLLGELRAMPGVRAATAMSGLPLVDAGYGHSNNTDIQSYTAPPEGRSEVVDYDQVVMSDYFETMGIPIVAGRSFDRTDAASAGRVVVVNETFASTFLPGQNPIGQRLRRLYMSDAWYTVIGVARDVKQGGVDQATGTELYFFVEQSEQFGLMPPTMNVVLRTTLPPAALSSTIEHVVGEVNPTVPIARLRDMDGVLAESLSRPRLLAQLVGAFAGLALLLAAVGTYGVLSYMVTERRREIGIRIALGAARSSVLTLVMKQGLQLTLMGVVVGVAGAFGLNRLMASLLFGVQPTDTATLVTVTATITLVAAFACWLPAWRASRLDPNVVLRAD